MKSHALVELGEVETMVALIHEKVLFYADFGKWWICFQEHLDLKWTG